VHGAWMPGASHKCHRHHGLQTSGRDGILARSTMTSRISAGPLKPITRTMPFWELPTPAPADRWKP
jgi:hypothetical protein